MAAVLRFVVLLSFLAYPFVRGELVNEQVTRKIDITTQVAKYTTTVVVKNSGSSPEKEFVYVIEPQLSGRLAYISAKMDDEYILVAEKEVKKEKYVLNVCMRIYLFPQWTQLNRLYIAHLYTFRLHCTLVPHQLGYVCTLYRSS